VFDGGNDRQAIGFFLGQIVVGIMENKGSWVDSAEIISR